MSITCSRCQADNNDIKYACWNCWAVLPRPLTEEDLITNDQKGKNNKKNLNAAPIEVTTLPSDPDVIAPPAPKKAGLFGGLGKKKVEEPVMPMEGVEDIFSDFKDDEEPVATTIADTNIEITGNEEKAPAEDIFATDFEIIPEPVKEKKGMFGFGAKKPVQTTTETATTTEMPVDNETTVKPEKKGLFGFGAKKPVQVVTDTVETELPVIADFVSETEPEPEAKPVKKGLFGLGKGKSENIQPIQAPDVEITPIIPEATLTTPIVTEPTTETPFVFDNIDLISEPVVKTDEDKSSSVPDFIDFGNDSILPDVTKVAHEQKDINASTDEVPFDFDFKAEVEKVFGNTEHTESDKKDTPRQPNKVRRIRPIREEDGVLKRPKRPQ